MSKTPKQVSLPLYPQKKVLLSMLYKRAIVSIKKAYLDDERPFYIGYSGGKDSSVVVDLVLKLLLYLKQKKIPLSKPIHVFTSDTLVEIPHVLKMMHTNLNALEAFILKHSLPIQVHRVYPDFKNRFFSQVIGVGMPLPRQDNRWCTDKMKILPTNQIISRLLGIDSKIRAIKKDQNGEYFIDKSNAKIYLSLCSVVDGKYVDSCGNRYQLSIKERFIRYKRAYPLLCDNKSKRKYFYNHQDILVYVDSLKKDGNHYVDINNDLTYWSLVDNTIDGNDIIYRCKRNVYKSIRCINGFIALTGSRRDESTLRATRIDNSTQEGSFLKTNQTYKFSNNLLPIESWDTQSVWNYLLQYSLAWLDATSLWNLYSDASGKGDECAFIGAGDKEVIEEGKVGCAKSRFGCWTCSLFQTDKSLDGLFQTNNVLYDPYISFREYMMKYQKISWALHRNVYKHGTHGKAYYRKDNDISHPRYGMILPGGLKLSIRLKLLIKLLHTEQQSGEILLSDEEIVFIQYRWLLEGDIHLSVFKAINKYRKSSFSLTSLDHQNNNDVTKWVQTISFLSSNKKIYRSKRAHKKFGVSLFTYHRFIVQRYLSKEKLPKMFFPTISEENRIRNSWKNDLVDILDIQELITLGLLNIPKVSTLFGDNEIDRDQLPSKLYQLLTKITDGKRT